MTPSGLHIALLGPPGEYKSSTVASAAKVAAPLNKKVVVACSPAGEALTAGYQHPNVETEVFNDPKWQPLLNSFQAPDWQRLIKWLAAVARRDDVYAIALDNLSSDGGLSDLAAHEILAQHNIASFDEYPDPRAMYGVYASKLRNLLSLTEQISTTGKHVIVTGWTQMREKEGAGTPQKVNVGTRSNPKLENQWEERMMPALLGKMRDKFAGYFSIVAYTKVEGIGKQARFYLDCLPSKMAGGKTRLAFKSGVNAARIPSDWKTLIESLEGEWV